MDYSVCGIIALKRSAVRNSNLTVKLPIALTRKQLALGGVCSFFLLWTVVLAMRPKTPVVAESINIVPSVTVDERLFLLRELNELNSSWPDENQPADQLQTTLGSLRQQATAIRNHLRDGKIDERLQADDFGLPGCPLPMNYQLRVRSCRDAPERT